MILKKDGLLVSVTIPPLVLGLEIDVGEVLTGIARLSYSRGTPNPDPTDILGDVGVSGGDLVGVDVLLEL